MEMGVDQYHVVTGNSSWLFCVHLNRCNDLLEVRDKNDHKLEARGQIQLNPMCTCGPPNSIRAEIYSANDREVHVMP